MTITHYTMRELTLNTKTIPTDSLNQIGERIHQDFEKRTHARDEALAEARKLTRFSSLAIRAMHRQEDALAEEFLQKTSEITNLLKTRLKNFSDLYYAGYTQDAIREHAEANITYALFQKREIPTPEELGVEYNTYLNALADVTGELRRRCLDLLRSGYSSEAERLLEWMDEIYLLLVTLDYPDAITNGARRQTDLVRGIVERTRADLTISFREQQLENTLSKFLPPSPGPEA